MKKIIKEIAAERKRQDRKWGHQNHHPMVWLSILGEEVGEANQAANEAYLFLDGYPSEADWSKYREELIQIGAVVIAMIESYDRKRGVYLEAFAERTQL